MAGFLSFFHVSKIKRPRQLLTNSRHPIKELTCIESIHVFKVTTSFGMSNANTCGIHCCKLFAGAGADAILSQSKAKGRNNVLS
jgi:hypothetical protein